LLDSAGIGFGPNGMRTLDLIEPRFRALYEKICVGNKPSDAQWVFFEALLMEEGLGKRPLFDGNRKCPCSSPCFIKAIGVGSVMTRFRIG